MLHWGTSVVQVPKGYNSAAACNRAGYQQLQDHGPDGVKEYICVDDGEVVPDYVAPKHDEQDEKDFLKLPPGTRGIKP